MARDVSWVSLVPGQEPRGVFEVLGDRLKQEGQAGHEPLTRETQRTSASSSASPT